ncbi:MAG TPA: hypothetical protein VHB98_10380 [Chloroflexota bacterium]|nr:hypothetical protein [Chloroflexota bacterium]
MPTSTDRTMRVLPSGRALATWTPHQATAAELVVGARVWPLRMTLLAVIAAASAFRWYLLLRYYVTPDADQTIVGLMARHVLLGERPIFYWGQPYTGAPEAYLTAGLFGLVGQSDVLLHIVPLAASVAFVVVTCVLAWRLYGPGIAALTGLYLSAAPILLMEWSAWAGSGYLEMMALGTAALLLVLPAPMGQPNRSWWRVPAAFFLLGLAAWIQPSAIFYALGVLALLVGRAWAVARAPRRWLSGLALSLCALAALAVGMLPMLIFNVQHQGQTVSYLLQRDTATSLSTLTVFSRALLWSGPIVLGLIPPTTDRTYLSRFLLDHYAMYGIALFVVLALLFRGLSLWRAVWARVRTVFTQHPAPDLGLIVLLAGLLVGFLSSSWGAEQWSGSQPRYLLPLYTAVPLILRAALPRRPRAWHWTLAALALIALCAGNLFTNSTTFGREDLRPLARLLQARGITAVYGDYWTVYPIIYESEERIAGVATNDDLARGYNRRLMYLQAAASSSHFAWVVATGSARQRAVLACFQRLHSRYGVVIWRDQTIYDRPTGRAFPYWNGGRCPLISPASAS